MRPSDTSPEAQRIMDDHYRQMTPAEKLAMLKESWATARTMALAGLRLEFPNETQEELDARWAERRLGKKLYRLARDFQQGLKR